MKAVILGDTHFGGGYSLGKIDPYRQVNSRLIDFLNTYDYVLDYMVSVNAKHLIISGDIFEHRRPQAIELGLFAEKINKSSSYKIHTHIIVGNHDLTFYQNATTLDILHELKLPYVHIYTDVKSVVCSDGETDDVINFIFIPFRNKKMLKCDTTAEAIRRLRDRIVYEVNSIGLGTKIAVGHFMLENPTISKSLIESSIGEIVLPLDIFKDLDATIMGHVHTHQIIQESPLISYIGSMERAKLDEGKHKKYFLVADVNDGNFTYEFKQLPVRNIYDLVIDQTTAKDSEDAIIEVKKYIDNYSLNNNLTGSIIRLQIYLTENLLCNFHIENIVEYLKEEHKINNCVGVFTNIAPKRQMRKESITEQADPITAFLDYLELEKNPKLKEKMKEYGLGILNERKL